MLSGVTSIESWGQGQFYLDKSGRGVFQQGSIPKSNKPAILLDSEGNLFQRAKPQYEEYAESDFISVKSQGAFGEEKTDDTAAIQNILNSYAGCKIIYFPSGIYLISSTIIVPVGTRIVGELWPVLAATGSAFGDLNNPVTMIKVGNPGDEGIVEISDILFSHKGQVPGAILVEWNIRDPAGQQGASAMWDSHFRIGGALGTGLDSNSCTKFSATTDQCKGAYLLLHLTSTSSAYLENVWAWTADHDLDNSHNQISIFNCRGILIESANGPVWMYGTASEHNVLYQYNVANAKNVFMGLIQTETPYYQSTPGAPYPFTTINQLTDPDFKRCNGSIICSMRWGLIIQNSHNIYVYGAGLYNFFQNYDQGCLNGENCQESMVSIHSNTSGVILYNLNT